MPDARADQYGESFKSINELLPSRASQYPGAPLCALLPFATFLLTPAAPPSADVPILGVPGRDGLVRSYTYLELETATNLLAHHLATVIPPRAKDDTSSLTCALLAPSGYDYAVHEMSLVRIGYAVLLVSPNNSPAAIAHLCKSTKASFLFTAPAYLEAAKEALALATEHDLAPPAFDSDKAVAPATQQAFEVLDLAPSAVYSDKAIAASTVEPYPVALAPADEGALTAFIVHSSGSTGFPKPIYITGASTTFNIATNFGLSGLTTLPLYHNHGHSCFWRALQSVRQLWLYPASDLPLTTPCVLIRSLSSLPPSLPSLSCFPRLPTSPPLVPSSSVLLFSPLHARRVSSLLTSACSSLLAVTS